MGTRVNALRDAHGREIDLSAAGDLLDRIIRACDPFEVWLFGSRARGHARADSDWDLLVVVPDDTVGVDDPLVGWRLGRGAGVPSDVLLCRGSDFREDRDTPNTLAFEAAHHGIRLYER
jgi:predicted nucleotidyltransferase